MLRKSQKFASVLALLAALGLATSSIASGHGDEKHNNSRVPVPKHHTAKGEKCVEPTDVMRSNHMEFILHQRDKTVHQGIRTKQHSLKNCVACHADPDTKSVLKNADGSEGFCAECHSYTAVKIDCFGCHTDKANSNKQTMRPIDDIGRKVIANTGGAK
ncbi:MAG: hypothetical protein AMS22_05230 [Thiotrichales bacterium SG8_50]|nr:MAG: hypothetical protein AMS22_05230 [Thiotrichales bacterium SG8_50]